MSFEGTNWVACLFLVSARRSVVARLLVPPPVGFPFIYSYLNMSSGVVRKYPLQYKRVISSYDMKQIFRQPTGLTGSRRQAGLTGASQGIPECILK